MTEENKNNPPQPLPAADTEVLQKEGAASKKKREEPPYVNEKLDRPPRFRNVRDVVNHIKLKRTASAYTRKEELIHEILNGQSEMIALPF